MPIYNSPIFTVDAKETKRYAGLQRTDFNPKLIEEACTEAQLLIAPKGIWQIYDYDAQTHTILPEGTVLQGRSITKHLANATKVVLLAATVGEEIEYQVTKSFGDGRYSFSVLLDAAATTAVEQVADAMEKTIKNEVQRQGLSMTWRFSPGYGDWPLEQQPEVLKLSGGQTIGISLTESLMLSPRKSITAIIGLYHQDEACAKPQTKHNCQTCGKTDCPARK